MLRLEGVLLAYFAENSKIALWIVVIVIALLNLNFIVSIVIQIQRLQKLFVTHGIVRNHWLDDHRRLSDELIGNQAS